MTSRTVDRPTDISGFSVTGHTVQLLEARIWADRSLRGNNSKCYRYDGALKFNSHRHKLTLEVDV